MNGYNAVTGAQARAKQLGRGPWRTKPEPETVAPMTRDEEEAAYLEYLDGLDERLADRFPEAF